MPRPKSYDDDLRLRLLETAGRLLREEGPHALTTRRVATEVGTSTTAIYSLIGSKEDLVRAVFLEGFRRLAAHLDAVPPHDDPLVHLAGLGEAYVTNAFENPHLYSVMFSTPFAEFEPSPDDYVVAVSTLDTLIETVQRCIDAGYLAGEAPDRARELWASAHGVVSLAINGHLSEDEAVRMANHIGLAMLVGLMQEANAPAPSEIVTVSAE